MASLADFYESLNDNHRTTNNDDLLIFGYSCKVFPPDDQTTFLEEERHLIPWSGLNNKDTSVKIDRYDCRLYLSELKPHEATSSSSDLTSDEPALVDDLQSERYSDLKKCEVLDHYKEEEAKRLLASSGSRGAEFHFNYDDDPNDVLDEVTVPNKPPVKVKDEPFVLPDRLRLPPDMIMPTTMKEHGMIEKTAIFVLQSGPQMEIVIKAKQKSNQQFNFLTYGHSLNPYYKFVLKCIKEKRYTPQVVPAKPEADENSDSDDDSDSDGGYLHPSLFASSINNTAASRDMSPALISSNAPKYQLGQENDVYSLLFNKMSALKEAERKKLEPPRESNGLRDPSQDLMWHQFTEQSGIDYSAMSAKAVTPPSEICLIIDRLAELVCKQGSDFEQVALNRKDPRFDFIKPDHAYYPYYQMTIAQYNYQDYVSKYMQSWSQHQASLMQSSNGATPSPVMATRNDSPNPASPASRVRGPLLQTPSGPNQAMTPPPPPIVHSTPPPPPPKLVGPISFTLKPKTPPENKILKKAPAVVSPPESTCENAVTSFHVSHSAPDLASPPVRSGARLSRFSEKMDQVEQKVDEKPFELLPPSRRSVTPSSDSQSEDLANTSVGEMLDSAIQSQDLIVAEAMKVDSSTVATSEKSDLEKQHERKQRARLFLEKMKRSQPVDNSNGVESNVELDEVPSVSWSVTKPVVVAESDSVEVMDTVIAGVKPVIGDTTVDKEDSPIEIISDRKRSRTPPSSYSHSKRSKRRRKHSSPDTDQEYERKRSKKRRRRKSISRSRSRTPSRKHKRKHKKY